MIRAVMVGLLVLFVAACSEHEFHPPSEEERSARADSLYDPAAFDSIAWSTDSARIATGNLVFADQCRRCHGPLGRGATEYAAANEIAVPSLVSEDWRLAGDIDSVRHAIFVGHGAMPEWGLGRLSLRELDAVAAYVIGQLRPEVLTRDPEIPGS
jgi:mono/diheme cytochrome c family protein